MSQAQCAASMVMLPKSCLLDTGWHTASPLSGGTISALKMLESKEHTLQKRKAVQYYSTS